MIDKKAEVSFLVDNFDIPAAKAAAVVSTDDAEIMALTAQQLRQERDSDPFAADAKVPLSPEDHVITDNGGMQKTVLRRKNDAGRAGP